MVRSARDAETVVLAPVPGPAPAPGSAPTPGVRPGAGDDPTVLQQVLPTAGRHRRGDAGTNQEQAIFLDRSGRRKRRVTWALALAAVGGLIYTVILVASMLGGVGTDSALPVPGESAAPSNRSPSALPSPSPSRSRSVSPAPRGPAPEVQAPVRRSARPSRSPSSSSAPPLGGAPLGGSDHRGSGLVLVEPVPQPPGVTAPGHEACTFW